VNKLYQLETALGYQFKQQDLFKQAVTHRSACHMHNERLEFLGDSVLSLVISKTLYHQFPKAKEGELTRMRSSLVCGQTLTEIAKQLGLGDHIAFGSGELKSGSYRRDSILENTLEAIIGAIYLDSDLSTLESVLLPWFASRLDEIQPDDIAKDPKTQLQEYLQQYQKPLPRYEVIGVTGQDHAQTFMVACYVVDLQEPVQASGLSRRKAEQAAAQKVLELVRDTK
jgi:ribonuclease III